MQLTLAYQGRSQLSRTNAGLAVSLAPNLRRDRVGFRGGLVHPVRFREAVSALHDIVVSDLRFQKRDTTAYEAYKQQESARIAALRASASSKTNAAIVAAMPELPEPIPPGFLKNYERLRKTYWHARDQYSTHLMQNAPDLWRKLVPCDPVITVAPDVVFLECFSVDESSYGCLTVDRNAFTGAQDAIEGTTNVDYSWDLYDHFQTLRSDRPTKFVVDPTGFEVSTGLGGDYREEKIDLPPSWLRGFMMLQSAMSLPARKISVSREGLYGVLAFLKRHKASRSPRAVRFELDPGKPVAIVLEPWERRIVLHDRPYDGPRAETIRVWGRDRLRVLARTLPLAESAEVHLLGSGLPSFWSVRMGEMRLLLGVSGWTTNDWTGASALNQLLPSAEPSDADIGAVASAFRLRSSNTLNELALATQLRPVAIVAALNRLALLGQVIHDIGAGVYRWRQVMPVTLSAELAVQDDPETVEGRRMSSVGEVRVLQDVRRPDGLRVLEGKHFARPISLLIDADGRPLRGSCNCSHHFTGGLRRGPCRHLQALRTIADGGVARGTLGDWLARLSS